MHNRFDSDFQEDLAVIQHRSWEGELVEEWRTELGHHMFLQLPEGGLAWQSLDVRSWIDPETGEELDLVGDRLMETLSDGSTRTVSSVWDWLPVEENLFFSLPSLYPQGVDWSHGNSLELSPDGEHYLLSLGNAGVVAQLDRESGEPVWMSGAQGVPLHEGSLHFEHQHGDRWQPEGGPVFIGLVQGAVLGAPGWSAERVGPVA